MVSVRSAAVMGIDVRPVRVEVSITRGTPMIQIVGLAQSAVQEGRERIRAVAAQMDLHVPGMRITVNLAPADIPKTGAALDLPIILGILCGAGEIPRTALAGMLAVGELGLDGSLRPIRGALPIALHAAEDPDVRGLILPAANLRESAVVTGVELLGSESLARVLRSLRGNDAFLAPDAVDLVEEPPAESGFDMSSVKGQPIAKRALEIAAAGGHNLLLSGCPGSGKTSLARCLPGLLPDLTLAEAVEVTAIHSVAGLLPEGAGLKRSRPFRAPHHSISEAGLIGGGSRPRPGEVSLAHQGVLFLDELPEFGRRALETLRQPIEEGRVRIVRAAGSASFPAEFTLVAAMNPCPCGYRGVPGRCRCADSSVRRYAKRVSGPLLDRIDLTIDVPAVSWAELEEADGNMEKSAAVKERVVRARSRAVGRGWRSNARMPAASIKSACAIDRGGRLLLRKAIACLNLSARGYHRSLRVARTIADLGGQERISEDDVAEAIRFRRPE